jgi:hypothetical protein
MRLNDFLGYIHFGLGCHFFLLKIRTLISHKAAGPDKRKGKERKGKATHAALPPLAGTAFDKIKGGVLNTLRVQPIEG